MSQSFVPWFTDQVNLDMSGSHSRQGLLGLASPSAKHMPSMLHVLSWQPEAAEHHPETERRRATCVVLWHRKKQFIFKMGASPDTHVAQQSFSGEHKRCSLQVVYMWSTSHSHCTGALHLFVSVKGSQLLHHGKIILFKKVSVPQCSLRRT